MPLKASTKFIQKILQTSGGFNKVLNKVKIIEAEDGNCLAELKVSEEHINPFGTLHGGFTATLVDSVTSSALVTHDQCGRTPTVSVSLNIIYLKEAVLGDEIVIHSSTDRVGRTLAHLKCKIKNKTTGELLATGTLTAYIIRQEDLKTSINVDIAKIIS